MRFAMIGQLLDAPGFDTGACRNVVLQRSHAVAALTAGALSVSLLIAIAILSLDVLRATAERVL
jgi:hypothetical protein